MQGTLRYTIVGDGIAESLFELEEDQANEVAYVSVVQDSSLRVDFRASYSLRIRAFDSVYPDNFAEGVLTINVRRNLNSPVFLDTQNYFTTIFDTHPLGGNIMDVNATDADMVGEAFITCKGHFILSAVCHPQILSFWINLKFCCG